MSINSDQILLKAKDIEVGFPIIEGFVQAVRGASFDIIQGSSVLRLIEGRFEVVGNVNR